VENIQALEYGMRQIGLSAEIARDTLENMSRAMRLNPGLEGLLNQLGVKTEGRDRVQVLGDLVEQLRKMPSFVSAQYAGLFGIDPDTLLMMEQGLGEMRAAQKQRRQMNRDYKIDAQEAAAAAKEYMNTLREIWERIELFGQSLSIRMLPYFRDFMNIVRQVLKDLSNLKSTDLPDLRAWHNSLRDILDDLREIGKELKILFTSKFMSGALSVVFDNLKDAAGALLDGVSAVLALATGQGSKAASKAASGAGKLASITVRMAGVAVKTVMDLIDWNWPSMPPSASGIGRGLSIPTTRNLFEWGKKFEPTGRAAILRDELISQQGQLGSSSGGDRLRIEQNIAELTKELARSGGGIPALGTGLSLAGGGMGLKGDNKSVVVQQKTDIHVTGGDAAATGRSVASEQGRVNGDLVRNLVGAVR
jgi:hypothetical protein